ncbi:MAG: surface protein [Flavipsychrobacter sp.]|nr:surface protein [Flavipsychrobacter sp.]
MNKQIILPVLLLLCFLGITKNVLAQCPISAAANVCEAGIININMAGGGNPLESWGSNNGNISVAGGLAGTGTAIVHGVNPGTSIIQYYISGALQCGKTVTIIPLPVAGSISGSSVFCNGGSVTLTHTGPMGGNWQCGNTHASVNSSGQVTGISAGTETITYRVANVCGYDEAYHAVQVDGPSATIIGALSVCNTGSLTLAGYSPGGTWSSTVLGTATIDVTTGVVTPVSAGTTIISYTGGNTCGASFTATATLTVDAPANTGTITGGSGVCSFGTLALANPSADPGGTWSSDDAGVATVSAAGLVTGQSPGTATISYTLSNMCGTYAATLAVTTNPRPGTPDIGGLSAICNTTGSTTLSDISMQSGTWTSSDPGIATVGPTTGMVNATTTPGTTTITYTVTNGYGCTNEATHTITVDVTTPATGTIYTVLGHGHELCYVRSRDIFSTETGGTWSSSNTAVVTVFDSAGVEYAKARVAGTATITYRVTNTCNTAFTTFTVVSYPAVLDTIIGAKHVCAGSTITLSHITAGGVWSSANSTMATIGSSTGVVTGLRHGTATIIYDVTNTCVAAVASMDVIIDTLPEVRAVTYFICPPMIAGYPISPSPYYTAVSSPEAGGTWSSSNTTIATVSATGPSPNDEGWANVFSQLPGTATISYLVTSLGCGTSTASHTVTVVPPPLDGLTLSPASVKIGIDPTFTLMGTLTSSIAWFAWYTDSDYLVKTGTATVTSCATTNIATSTVGTSVELLVHDVDGCIDYVTIAVSIHP